MVWTPKSEGGGDWGPGLLGVREEGAGDLDSSVQGRRSSQSSL